MTTLDVGYHLTSSDHRSSILKHGLLTMQPIADRELVQPDGTPVAFPWVCLGTTVEDAWALLPAAARSATDAFDIWQVWLADTDHLEVRTDLGLRLREVRVMHPIPADRVRHVGTRTV